MITRFLLILLSAASSNASAQLPSSGALSDSDWLLFRAELARVEKLPASASDKDTITYEMARIWASAKQWQETMLWLRRVANLKAGLDPSRDSLFAELRGTREFAEITAAVREATPAISHSRPVFQVTEGDLVPEGVAYDPKGRYFYFGSMRKGKVVRCSSSGECSQFAGGLDTVLGLKVHGKKLWLLNNSGAASALICYDLASGGMLRKYVAGGAGGSYGGFAKRLVWRPHLRPDAAG